ncbi:phage tail tape measure protein [Microvirga massiliensis]|uniref:phage tail tape measure protein n=1 Tax=Microvirga massiliensis TaxID=1033741 RepID=UPI00062B421E|nr:phage tail tape measure protein [Microvirga massiliensis]
MSSLNVSLVLQLIDKLTRPLKNASKEVDAFGRRSKKAHIGLSTEGRKAERAVKGVAVATKQEAKAVNASTIAIARQARVRRESARAIVAEGRAAERTARTVRRYALTGGRGSSGGVVPVVVPPAAAGGHLPHRRSGGGSGGSATPYGQFAAGMGGAITGRFGMTGFGAAAGGIAVAAGAYKATESALSFEKVMTEVEKATDANAEKSAEYAQKLLDLSRATGKTKEELGTMLAQAGFAGRPAQELLRFTEYGAKATVAWGTNAEETGQALAELGNIYGAHQGRIEEIGDAINTAADISASRESDLLEFLRRSGASGKLAGISAEQTLAFGAALKEVGVRTDVAATGFEALMNVMRLGEEFSDKASKGLEQLGVSSNKMRREFIAKPLEATLGFLQKIAKVSDPMKRAEILTNIFGKEYQDDISKLLNQLPRLNSLLKTMGNRANYIGSVDAQFGKQLEKDFNRLQRAQASIDTLATRIGEPLKVAAGSVAESINDAVDAIEKGETKFQRILSRANAYLDERDGRKPGEIAEIPTPAPEAEAWAEKNLPFLSGKVWNEALDEWIGKTPDDAARKGREAARAEKIAGEDRIIARAADLQTRIGKAETARVPIDTIDALRRELETVTKLAGEIVVRRHVESLGMNRAEASLERAQPLASGLATFGFGKHGTNTPPPGVPLPPPRPTVDTSEIDAATQKAEAAGSTITTALNVSAAPVIDTTSIDAADAKVDALIAKLARIGPLAAQANKAIASAQSGPAQGKGYRQGALLQDPE